jgi:glycosyltransferase involved in cell wall biosynthesis
MSYVLHLAGWYPNHDDPYHGDFVQRHARAIATFEKIIVVFAVKSASVKKITLVLHEEGNLLEYIYYYPKKKIADKFFSNFTYLKIIKKAGKKIFSEFGLPAIVHVNIAWKAGIWALYLKRKFNCNYIITENWTGYYAADPNYTAKHSFQFGILKKIFKQAAAFIPVTRDLAETVNRLFQLNLPFTVIENAVDTGLFFPEKHFSEKPKIVHVSTMNFQKNTDGLLRVIKKLAAENLNFELLLIGPCAPELKEKIYTDRLLKNFVTVTGNVPYTTVAELVRSCDCMVLFSRYENLPCVILESLCAGIPVIASDVGGIREVLNPANGILVQSEHETELENAIRYMLKNLHLYDQKEIASQAAAAFSYEAIGKKFQDAYTEILK